MVDGDGRRARQARLDVLRRRLYRPDVSEEDRRRFLALQADVDRDRTAGPPVPARAPRSLPRRRVIAAGSLGLLVVGAALVVPRLSPPRASTAASGRTRVVDREVAQNAYGGSSVPSGAPSALVATPAALVVDGLAVAGQRFHGTGAAVVPIGTGTAVPGGRLAVAFWSSDPDAVTWWALRIPTARNGLRDPQVVAVSDPEQEQDLAHPGDFAYDGDPPSRIVVQDPGAHRWALTAAFLPRPSASLR